MIILEEFDWISDTNFLIYTFIFRVMLHPGFSPHERKTMNELDLYTELQQKTSQLDVSIKSLRKTGQAFAEAERDYKILLRTECLKLRDDGMPVTLIQMTCYGIPSVAEARFKRDMAEAVYRANQEAINSIKLQMRLIEAQIQREWGGNLAD